MSRTSSAKPSLRDAQHDDDMLSIQACRETLEASGMTGLTDDQIEHARYVLAQVARLQLKDQFGIEADLPPKPLWLPETR